MDFWHRWKSKANETVEEEIKGRHQQDEQGKKNGLTKSQRAPNPPTEALAPCV
jgi:hypothetical protein